MVDKNVNISVHLIDKTKKQAKDVSKNISGIKDGAKESSKSLLSLQNVFGLVTAKMAFDAIKLGVDTAASLESAAAGFKTLLGSAEAAKKTMDRIKLEAKRTPFEITGLTQAVQMLSGVTKDGDKAIDIIMDVGEALAALGRGQPELDRIAVNLQQIAATGRATMLDIKQFAFAGIPIFEMLSEATGKSGEALAKFIEDGGVTFDMITKMFKKATDEGGRFAGAFENQAGTFNQLLANLKDEFSIFMSDLITTTGLFDGLKYAMQGISGVLKGLRGEWTEFDNAIKKAGGSLYSAFNIDVVKIRNDFMVLFDTLDSRLQIVSLQAQNAFLELAKLPSAITGSSTAIFDMAIEENNKAMDSLGVKISETEALWSLKTKMMRTSFDGVMPTEADYAQFENFFSQVQFYAGQTGVSLTDLGAVSDTTFSAHVKEYGTSIQSAKKYVDWIVNAKNKTGELGSAGVVAGNQLSGALSSASRNTEAFKSKLEAAIARVKSLAGSWGGLSTNLVFDRGAIQQKKQEAKPNASRATGGSFVVPSGFPNDSFRLGLTSGERATVEPANSRGGNNSNITINMNVATNNATDLINQINQLLAKANVSARLGQNPAMM